MTMHKDSRDDPGIYIIKLKKPAFGLTAGRIIYVGKGGDVEKRLNQELGKVTGAATFFRSIGVMLGKTIIPGSGKNFRFYERREIADWIDEHTQYTIKRCDLQKQEKKLIKEHKPPFNCIYNSKHYHRGLLELRKKAKAMARK